jgi:DNA repair protein RecO (recombination protein O)
MKILLQPAYIIHSRPYRDTSLLLELFTQEHGRVSVVARGAKGPRSQFKGLLQPFAPLVVSWLGKTELMMLTAAEAVNCAFDFRGNILLCGFYLNELIMRLLHRYDPHPQLYQIYQQTLINLQQEQSQQIVLRQFEKQLLTELGYALQLNQEALSGDSIVAEYFYRYDPLQGLIICDTNQNSSSNIFCGESLLALHENRLDTENTLRDAKRLLRMALHRLLGDKPIKSRELFI